MSEDKKNGKQNKTVKPFDPMTLRGVTVRNRIWLPPMDTYSALAQDGKPTPFHYQHYVSRAMGGFGIDHHGSDRRRAGRPHFAVRSGIVG